MKFVRVSKSPVRKPSWDEWTRRTFLRNVALAAGAIAAPACAKLSSKPLGSVPPRAPTSVVLCKRYDYSLVRRNLAHVFEELGDVRTLVKGKSVTVKTNLVNSSAESLGGLPLGLTVTTHPSVALALGSLLVDYGARHVTFCDQLPFKDLGPEPFSGYGFDFGVFSQEMEGKVRFVNTRNRGNYSKYASVKVPGNGEIAGAWEVNRTYVETDVLISLAKLKSHVAAGVTLGMKNLFGVPPSSLYGDDLTDRPDEEAVGYRNGTMHRCDRKPFTSTETFTGKSVLGDHGFNVPRLIVDLNAAFPIDLVVIDGISAIQTAEGWWNGSMVSVCSPGLLIAGRNAVCTDAVATSIMGFDPEAADRTHPFANGVNYLTMARKKGLGENRISALQVGGIGLDRARYHYLPTYQRVNS
jgi:uncharacterized protein (DUF362 family)